MWLLWLPAAAMVAIYNRGGLLAMLTAGAVIFFLATAYLLGREYFLIAALRLHPIHIAKALWRARRWEIFSAGLLIAAFVLIPIVNLATPLFATAFMVHVNKRLAATPRRLVEPHA